MKKHVLSILLALIFLLTLPVAVYAAEDTPTCDNLKHNYDDGVCTICGNSVLGSTWLAPNIPDGDYTIVALPDPQWLVDYNPEIYYKLIQWIVDHKEELNIIGVLGLGDMTDDNNVTQWTISQKGMDMLTEAGIPWMPSQGNHDSYRNYSHKTDYFNQFFDYESYGPDQPWFGGSFHDDKLDHTYWFINGGKREYIVFSMGWAPSWEAIDWMEEIIQANPNKNVIYTAHAYMTSGNQLIGKNSGASVNSYGEQYSGYPEGTDIYGVLSHYKNFVLGVGGHIMYADLSVYVGQNASGRAVYNLLMDAQDKDTKTSAYAMLGLYTFNNENDQVKVSWYSTWFDALYKSKNQITITVPHVHVHDYRDVVVAPTCQKAGYTSHRCKTCGDYYVDAPTPVVACNPGEPVRENEVAPTRDKQGGYDEVTYCTYCSNECSREHKVIEIPAVTVDRISGKNRSATALAAADALKAELGTESFDVILLASGSQFADALAGSYLAAVKSAPILLHTNQGAASNQSYITKTLSADGTVYILGGSSAVPQSVEDGLKERGVTVKRLSGKDRFATNIAILQEAGIAEGQEILVCTGYNFADSLSASATGMPILLVNSNKNTLTEVQKDYLNSLDGCVFTIIGGTGAVGETLMQQLEDYGDITGRISGKTRYETSVLIAKTYFENPDCVFLAYGQNFPDGLCGGPLAYVKGAPLLLVQSGQESKPATYVMENNIFHAFVMGGTGVISDDTVAAVMN